MQMAGLTVLMIKTKDQVIYKLPDNMSVQSLSQEQREQLLTEINLLHHRQTTAQAIAATQAQTQQVQMAQAQAQAQGQGQGVRQIAPSSQNSSSNINGSAAGVSSASTSVGSGSYRSSPSAPSTPTSITGSDAHGKTTRRYNKTGKYSKKKLSQQYGLDLPTETTITTTSSSMTSTTNGHPYAKPQKPQQPLVFNNTSVQAYQQQAVTTPTTPTTPTTAATIPITVSGISSSVLQQQLQRQQATGLATLDQKRQFKLLQEIHQLQQQIEAQQTRLTTFREQEQTIRHLLTLSKATDSKTLELAHQSVVTAEKSLEALKTQLREKESVFREQFPVASQQLLLLQQQQQLIAASGSGGSTLSLNNGTLSSSSTTLPGSTTTTIAAPAIPKTVEEQLQQRIAEHHDSVRNGMAQDLLTTHKDLRRPDYRTPFSSLHDAIERLVPFHVFQYPSQDIEAQAKAFASRSEAELNARALSIHKRKYDLFNKYNHLLEKNATKPTNMNPSSALDIVALRLCLDEERAEHKRVFEQKELVQNQAKTIREELELRQVHLLQQRKTEAVLIEQQQRLILERLRQEELERQQLEHQQQHMMAQIRQIQELQHQHQQEQQDTQMTEEQEEQKRHQLELEKQMRKKQEQEEAEHRAAAAAVAVTAAIASSSTGQSLAPVITTSSSTTPAPNSSSTS
ncbi:hypothetical protein BGZ65_001407 [Modicella reniformis]|uniref:GLTSCR protein conserved domain-containing protein n=1 Tax=Modicella reniformis TaxID=1440133 RepID=A0A9P6SUL7_9FUNG|nr:hypothetical protein BGZ65_001407 [Modicella reniformis]